MGDNGAGKSTLVKIIAGNSRPPHGDIRIEGETGRIASRSRRAQKGIEIVYQDLALCNNLTAAANVFLGREIKKGVGPFRVLDHGAMYRRAGELFANSSPKRVRAISCAKCRAASARRSRSRARGFRTPRSC